jgi:hypothetical protein
MKTVNYQSLNKIKTSIRIYLVVTFSLSIILMGCSTAPTFINPNYENKQIKKIGVMPVTDRRDTFNETIEAKESLIHIEEMISKIIVDKNYDVVSATAVKKLLNQKEFQNLTPEYLCSTLNVDGILFSELYNYADDFYIDHSIKMHFSIFDAQGDKLWVNDLDDSDKPFLSALGASVGWAIGVAVDNKVSSKNKLPTILAGVAAAELIYVIVDGVSDETSESIDRVFNSLPEVKGTIK